WEVGESEIAGSRRSGRAAIGRIHHASAVECKVNATPIGASRDANISAGRLDAGSHCKQAINRSPGQRQVRRLARAEGAADGLTVSADQKRLTGYLYTLLYRADPQSHVLPEGLRGQQSKPADGNGLESLLPHHDFVVAREQVRNRVAAR